MKRISSVHLKNFKAFRDQLFDFDGKHVLIYGTNGSGKSSLFWALYTFLQSSRKEKPAIQRYFQAFDADDDTTFRSLKNVFADETDDAFIKLTWVDTETGILTELSIAKEETRINTNVNGSAIREADLASDFINYKLLQNFYNVSHRQAINLWDVFIRDIFPFFGDGEPTYLERLRELKLIRGRNAREKNDREIDGLNEQLQLFLSTVELNGNAFLKDHFFDGQDVLRLHFLPQNHVGIYPFIDREWAEKNSSRSPDDDLPTGRINLWVETVDQTSGNWIANHRPHSFLNEAQLTRLAIAVRIGALQTRPTDPDFKVLCLDDMLISLDMSNRDKVIKMILNYDNRTGSDYFDGFQKIILTHDKGFYNIIRRYTYPQDWKYYELRRDERDNSSPPVVTPGKGELEKAEDFFRRGEFEDCAIHVRKEIEELMKGRLNLHLQAEYAHQELGKLITSVRNRVGQQEQQRFDKVFAKRGIPIEHLEKLNDNYQNDTTLSPADKGKLTSLKNGLHKYLLEQYRTEETATQLMDKTRFVIDFYLNQNAHSTTLPNYENEVREALETVSRLKIFFGKEHR